MDATRPVLLGDRLSIAASVCLIMVALLSAPGSGRAAPSENYSNLVSVALLQRAQEVSRALTAIGLLPTESFTHVSIEMF
jgi:hypothetical protein